MGEGSFGNTLAGTSWWIDPYAQGGYVAKYFAALWSNTVPSCTGQNCTPCSWQNGQVCQQAFWYGYDHDVTISNNKGFKLGSYGALYCPGYSLQGECGNPANCPPNCPSFLITPQADMYNVAVSWLTNAIPAATPFCNNNIQGSTVWYCDFTTANGNSYRMIWDNSYAADEKVNSDYCHSTFGSPPLRLLRVRKNRLRTTAAVQILARPGRTRELPKHPDALPHRSEPGPAVHDVSMPIGRRHWHGAAPP